MGREKADDGVNASEGSTGDVSGVTKASNQPAEATIISSDVPVKRVWNRHARAGKIQAVDSTANTKDENTT